MSKRIRDWLRSKLLLIQPWVGTGRLANFPAQRQRLHRAFP
jgi:hypothetical protein